MREVVLDASVVLKWFHQEGEANSAAARRLRKDFEAGELRVVAPPLLWLEVLNVAARRWRWGSRELDRLAGALPELGFEEVEPELEGVAEWAAQGLTAYDAAYVATAEDAGVPLITDDAEICRVAPEATEPLSEVAV
jgi:predicted nucleic acid-binding protein